jgi:hypothetical protein
MIRPTSTDLVKAAVLAIFEEAAVKGERCPSLNALAYLLEQRGIPHSGTGIPPMLAREGKIRIEISAKNWRVVEILRGPHRRKRTPGPPGGAKPWLVVDASGSRKPAGHNRQGRIGRGAEVEGFDLLDSQAFR